jgi:lysylphosphatidylglycerol synthetase-like protein (DUF2156 family)
VSNDGSPVNVDDLADRLIEKRERLHYFIVTASAAVIAFSLGALQPPRPPLTDASKTTAMFAGAALLLAAGTALGGIFYRHRVYANYLDVISGLRQPLSAKKQKRIRKAFAWIEGVMIGLFFAGFAVLAGVDAVVLL